MTEPSQPRHSPGSHQALSESLRDAGATISSPASLIESVDSSACSCVTCLDLESQQSAPVTHSGGGRVTFLRRLRNMDIRPTLPFWISRFLGYRPDGICRPIWALRWLDTYRVPLVVEEYVASCFCTIFTMICVIMVNSMTAFSSLPIPLTLGSVGAISIALFLTPDLPTSTPRNTLLSHLFSSVTATVIAKLFLKDARINVIVEDQMMKQTVWIWSCIALTLSVLFQKTFNLIHPAAGATALLGTVQANYIQIGWAYVGFVMTSVLITIAVALVWGNIGRRSYPLFWLTAPTSSAKDLPSETIEGSSSAEEMERSSTHTTSEASSGISYPSASSSKERHSTESNSASEKSSQSTSHSIESFQEKTISFCYQLSSNLSKSIKSSST